MFYRWHLFFFVLNTIYKLKKTIVSSDHDVQLRTMKQVTNLNYCKSLNCMLYKKEKHWTQPHVQLCTTSTQNQTANRNITKS